MDRFALSHHQFEYVGREVFRTLWEGVKGFEIADGCRRLYLSGTAGVEPWDGRGKIPVMSLCSRFLHMSLVLWQCSHTPPQIYPFVFS